MSGNAAAPRWLSTREQAAWRSFLDAIQLLNTEVENQLQRDSGLSHADYEILVRLSEQPEHSMRMSELATRTLFSRSRLSHAVARLEREGWVRREPYPDDRRGLIAVLTDRGFETLAAAAPGHVETVRTGLLDPLTPQQIDQLADIAQSIIADAQARQARGANDEPGHGGRPD
jgi:DNA-binding MarR family transcriptional regulator